MRYEVWVHGSGSGPVDQESLRRVPDLLGKESLGISGLRDRWSIGLAVDAASLEEALELGSVRAQAAAAAAGLPDWAVNDAHARSPREDTGDGFTEQQVMSAFQIAATFGDDDGAAGDREPRRPITDPPSIAIERELRAE